MIVKSLFDGISCGYVAAKRVGLEVSSYIAYEIDEDAIKVSDYNHDGIIRYKDVFDAIHEEGDCDLLIGGSPCTHWSVAKRGDRETSNSGIGWELFQQYVRALRESKPKYFLYENNYSMSDEIRDCITEELGIYPIMIDSADFSAQIRKRYYWTNIPILEWEPSKILFSDIMDDSYNHSRKIDQYKDTFKYSKDGKSIRWDTSGKGHYSQANRARKIDQKFTTVCAAKTESKHNVWLDDSTVRLITISELEKLQTLPVGYTSCLSSKEKRSKGIGNGWTVDVIAHIFKGLKGD